MNIYKPTRYITKDSHEVLIREAAVQDAGAVLEHVEQISGESDYLTVGPGEFELTIEQEEEYLRDSHRSDNKLYIIALIEEDLVGALSFSAGSRSRVRHSGELAMSVRKSYWGLGLGSRLLDALMGWAMDGQIVKKINLRVRTDNLRAIQLYERKGFVKEGLVTKAIYMDDQFYDVFWMGLEI
jgi:RimJ/RimL family protein N-acetyltransferase